MDAQRLTDPQRGRVHVAVVLTAKVVHAAGQFHCLGQLLHGLAHVGNAAVVTAGEPQCAAVQSRIVQVQQKISADRQAIPGQIVHPGCTQQHSIGPGIQHALFGFQLVAAIDVGGGERCILVKRSVLNKARVDLVRAERNQLCAAFLRCSRHPARQQNVGAVGFVRVLFAVARVGESRRVYYTTNHGEQALTSTLTDALESQNLTVSALDLLSQTIPEDCDLLVINDPAQDFSGAGSLVDELGQLRSYLSNGGRVLLLTDSYYSTPNLDAVMAEFGLTRTEGLVVEGDTNHYLSGYPALYLLPDYASTEESTALDGVNTSRRVLLQMAQGITLTETEHVVSDTLLVSSDSAYSKPEGYEMTTTEKADGDIAGPFTLAAYARNENTGAQVIWVNCGNMDNEGIYQVIPGNVTFLQGCAASLAGQESAVLIDSKALEAAPLEVPGIAASTLGLLFVIVLPAALLAVGAVVVVLRRRK